MIHRYHNHKSIVPILPATCYSTDDTTDYIFQGYGNNRKGLFRSLGLSVGCGGVTMGQNNVVLCC